MTRTKTSRAKAAQADALGDLVNKLASSPEAVDLLRGAAHPAKRMLFSNFAVTLARHLHLDGLAQREELFSEIVQWIATHPTACPSTLHEAAVEFQEERALNRKIHRILVSRLGLSRDPGHSWVSSLPKYSLNRLDTPYPPLGHFVSESPEIRQKWEKWILEDPQPDPRKARCAIHDLDPSKLQLTIPIDESCVIIDKKDKSIVAVVLRNMVGEEDDLQSGFISWAVKTVKDGITGRRSIRLEDPGQMIQAGYSAGARSKPAFHWVRNLLRKEGLTAEFLASADYQTSCLFAVGWNMCRAQLPGEIMDNWVDWLQSNALPRMDAGIGIDGTLGDYEVPLGDQLVTFHNAELAPPTGLLNQNYARAMHYEPQPHPYSIQWILSRSHPTDQGGHFYIASYGVQIVLAPDTLISWRPADIHGTSLANYSPYESSPAFQQLGIAFVTPPRLNKVYQRYKESLPLHDTHAEPILFGKHWTGEDEAADAAAQEFIADMVAGIVEDPKL
ncbi:hypothetical protein LXA43DRAFT_1100986 [Ganoderma leucocontextum]|nr:hypothetical protein LXA43DRAFT_1100986 [Ganoderma leucocontextum]